MHGRPDGEKHYISERPHTHYKFGSSDARREAHSGRAYGAPLLTGLSVSSVAEMERTHEVYEVIMNLVDVLHAARATVNFQTLVTPDA